MRRSVPIAILTCCAFLWTVLWPDLARAQAAPSAPVADDSGLAAAKLHFESGRAAFNANDFPTAIREFKAAEALRPSPILAYNIGLANEKMGRRRVAVRYFKRYLEGAPAATNRAEVDARIAGLEREIAAAPAQSPDVEKDNPPAAYSDPNHPPPPTVQTGSDPYAGQPITTAPANRGKRNLWWVWVLVGVGGALVITAIVVGSLYAGANDTNVLVQEQRVTPAATRNGLLGSELPTAARSAQVAPLLELRF